MAYKRKFNQSFMVIGINFISFGIRIKSLLVLFRLFMHFQVFLAKLNYFNPNYSILDTKIMLYANRNMRTSIERKNNKLNAPRKA